MPPPTQFPRSDYKLDEELSDELRYRINTGTNVRSPKLRIALIVMPIVIFSSVAFGVPIVVAAGVFVFALMLILLAKIQIEGDAISIVCPSCGNRMEKEMHGGMEYFVCHGCERYAEGRDWT